MVTFRGGRNAPDPTLPRLKFSQFSTGAKAKQNVDWFAKVDKWPMYLNDKIGDCTIAAAAHMIESWTAYGSGRAMKVTDADVLAAYVAVSGYNPITGAHDDGAVMQKVLSYWRKTGIAGHKILAFASVNFKDADEARQATEVFGEIYLGINFPGSAMDQFDNGQSWSVVPGAVDEGGHAICSGWYDSSLGLWKVITWGQVQTMTQEFFDKYVEEAWAVISTEWFDANGKTPEGIDQSALGEAFTALTGDPSPFQGPDPTPVPDPTPSPSPEPVDDGSAGLESALRKFLRGKNGPKYLRTAANNWMEKRNVRNHD